MHGTPFRRAVEEGLIDPRGVVMIGMRGTTYDSEDRRFADSAGIRVIPIEEYFRRGIEDVMVEARAIVDDRPTYVSFDIDFVDPAFAPGTGTPEVGGPSSFEALQVVRALADVNIIGADLVEVSPPFDSSGATVWLGASLMFELLCVMVQGIARGNSRQRIASGEHDGRNLYDQLLVSRGARALNDWPEEADDARQLSSIGKLDDVDALGKRRAVRKDLFPCEPREPMMRIHLACPDDP
jgi:Arginase family